MRKLLKIFFWCKVFKEHKWTSHHQKGIKPTKEQLSTEKGFWEYAKMYCDRCGYESKLNIK